MSGKVRMSEEELGLLAVIHRIRSGRREATAETISYLVERKIPTLANRWPQTAERLVHDGILRREAIDANSERFAFTSAGEPYASYVAAHNFLTMLFYEEFYQRSEQSQAHGEFCRRVYGRNCCQHGMMDMAQLQELLVVLDLTENSAALDAGCGNGYIAEYISDVTGCNMTGIDILPKTLAKALVRTEGKRDRINFAVQDMDCLDLSGQSFDAIISVDSLYFVKNLTETMRHLYECLNPRGKLALFYHVPPEDEDWNTLAKSSHLGVVLDELDYPYEVRDFSAANAEHWDKKTSTLLALKDQFETEGNSFLYQNRMDECLGGLGKWSRFLYIVSKDCTSS